MRARVIDLMSFAAQLTGKAFVALKIFKGRAVALKALAEFLLKRDR